MESATRQEPASVWILRRLPCELVHRVLDLSPLCQILRLMSHNVEYINRCGSSHFEYGTLFNFPEGTPVILEYFILLCAIREYQGVPLSSEAKFLIDDLTAGSGKPYKWEIRWIRQNFIHSIRNALALGDYDFALLKPHEPRKRVFWEGETPTEFRQKFQWIKKAKHDLNVTKSTQLNIAAYLVDEYPLALRRPFDPNQDVKSSNAQQMARRFRYRARDVLKDHNFKHSGRCIASTEVIEVVPYGRYLRYFLAMLASHPPRNPTKKLRSNLDQLYSAMKDTIGVIPAKYTFGVKYHADGVENGTFEYPKEIGATLKVVIYGLQFVYTELTEPELPRIEWFTKTESAYVDEVNLRFKVDTRHHRSRESSHPIPTHWCPVKSIMPHDEREYEWLEAFLRMVTWMEENFGGSVMDFV